MRGFFSKRDITILENEDGKSRDMNEKKNVRAQLEDQEWNKPHS